MQMVSDFMTRDVRVVAPQESVQHAAQLMDEMNVGALPVCDGERLVGMVTDRDITIRATAAGRSPQEVHVDEVMSTDVRWCFEDQPLDDVMVQMADSRIRRIPVVSHDDAHRLVGIVSLGDVATRTPDGAAKEDVEQVLESVSSPSRPVRPYMPPEQVAGRSGEVPADAGSSRDAGVDLPHAGEAGGSLKHGISGGASGDPRTTSVEAGGTKRSGNTGDTQRNFGVGGQDLQEDGLPPA